MKNIEIIEKIINTIRTNKGLKTLTNFSEETRLRDLELDSLDLAEFTVRIEKETGIDVFADGIISTVGEVDQRIS